VTPEESVVTVYSAFAWVACAALLIGCGGGGSPLGPGAPEDAGGPQSPFVEVTLPASAFTSLRSDGMPQPLFVVGDEGITQVADRVVLTFDLTGFPAARHVVAAKVWLESRGVFDDFDPSLGDVEVRRVDLGLALDPSDFDGDPLTDALDGAAAPPYGFPLVLDVTQGLIQALDHGAGHLDLRLQTEQFADGDDAEDLLHLEDRIDPVYGHHGPELLVLFRR
jgi:hypothetical protein